MSVQTEINKRIKLQENYDASWLSRKSWAIFISNIKCSDNDK